MTRMKRILSLLLCLAMLLSVVPVGAFATDDMAEIPTEETILSETGETEKETTEETDPEASSAATEETTEATTEATEATTEATEATEETTEATEETTEATEETTEATEETTEATEETTEATEETTEATEETTGEEAEPVTVTDEEAKLSVTAPGVTGVTVTMTEEIDEECGNVRVILEIDVEGYTQGDDATVKVEAPACLLPDVEIGVWDGDAADGNLLETTFIDEEGYISFTTNHFSRYDLTQTAEPELAAEEDDGVYYILAGSDLDGADLTNVNAILDSVRAAHPDIKLDNFLFAGDYTSGTLNANPNTAVADLLDAVDAAFPLAAGETRTHVLAQGEYDAADNTYLRPTGGSHFGTSDDGYGVYVINEDAFPANGGNQTTIDALSTKLYNFLHTRMSSYPNQPVFILSHIPLLYSERTARDGSGRYAAELFEMINNAGHAGLNIFFLHGHNHGDDDYLGGDAIYLPDGTTNVPVYDHTSATNAYTTHTLQFTYMNAGYVGSFDGVTPSMTLFKVENSEDPNSLNSNNTPANTGTVTIQRFGAATIDGENTTATTLNLGNAGTGTSVGSLSVGATDSPETVNMSTPTWHNELIYSGEGDDGDITIKLISHHTKDELDATITQKTAEDAGYETMLAQVANELTYSGYYAYDVAIGNPNVSGNDDFFGTVLISYPDTWASSNVAVYRIEQKADNTYEYVTIPHKITAVTEDDGSVTPLVAIRAYGSGTYVIACIQNQAANAPVQYRRANEVNDITSGTYLIALDASLQQDTDTLVLPMLSSVNVVDGERQGPLVTGQFDNITQYEILGVHDYASAYEWKLAYVPQANEQRLYYLGARDDSKWVRINSDGTITAVTDQSQADAFQIARVANNPSNADSYAFAVYTVKDDGTTWYLSYNIDPNTVTAAKNDPTQSRFVFMQQMVFDSSLGAVVSNPTLGQLREVSGMGLAAMYEYSRVSSVSDGSNYLIGASNAGMALSGYTGSPVASGVTVEGNYTSVYTAGTALEWTFTRTGNNNNNTFRISTTGQVTTTTTTYYLRRSGNTLTLTTNADDATAWTVATYGSNTFRISNTSNNTRYLTYNTGTGAFALSYSNASLYLYGDRQDPTASATLYALADPGNAVDTDGRPLYAREGIYPVAAGTTEEDARKLVQQDVIVRTYTSSILEGRTDIHNLTGNNNITDDKNLSWIFADAYTPDVPGSYTMSIAYGSTTDPEKRISLGTVEVVVLAAQGQFTSFDDAVLVPMSTLHEDGSTEEATYKLHLEGAHTLSVDTGLYTPESLMAYVQSQVQVFRTEFENNAAVGSKVQISDAVVDWRFAAEPVTGTSGTIDTPGSVQVNVTYSYTPENGGTQTITLGTIAVNVVDKQSSAIALSSAVGYVSQNSPDSTILKDSSGNNIVLDITYTDGTTAQIPVTVGMLRKPVSEGTDQGYIDPDTRIPGYSTGWEVVLEGEAIESLSVTLIVQPRSENNYPSYPDEGAVKVNKTATGVDFQTTGISQVELSASGIPVKKGADVIVMVDTSGSMDDTVGGVTRNVALDEAIEDMIDIFQTPGEDGELMDIRVAMANFNGYAVNTANSNLPYYMDVTDPGRDLVGQFAFNTNSTWDAFMNNNGDRNPGVLTGSREINAEAFVDAKDLTYTLPTPNGGTNYDYAMDVIYQLGTAIKQKEIEDNNDYDRDLFVIFMSDGAPWQWNYFGSDQGDDLGWENWIASSSPTPPNNLYGGTDNHDHAHYYDIVDHDKDGHYNEHRMANAIKGDPNKEGGYTIIRKSTDGLEDVMTPVTGNDMENMYTVPGLGATMFSVSFCIDDVTSGYTEVISKEDQLKAINSLASDPVGVTQYAYDVTTADGLSGAFQTIAGQIAYAATQARFLDQLGDAYNLQLKTVEYTVNNETKTIAPTIEILSYAIWTMADYRANGCTLAQVGARKVDADGNPVVSTLEVIKFSADGKKAYSSLVDGNGDGVMGVIKDNNGDYIINPDADRGNSTVTDSIFFADSAVGSFAQGVIYAKTFVYNSNASSVALEGVKIPTTIQLDGTTAPETSNLLPGETFYWKMDTITTSELAMRYYVYLDGSQEGTRTAGSYATNNFAILYYDNYLENRALMYTNSPTMAWRSANVSYAFYLVNSQGQPVVNPTTGQAGGFANRVQLTQPVVYQEILLNSAGTDFSAMEVKAMSSDVLPKYYTLYDDKAEYHVDVRSDGNGRWEIKKDPNKEATTYVTQYSYNASDFSNNLEMTDPGDYSNTIVWFAVEWTLKPYPDTVVIDYGLPVSINVLENDMFGDIGVISGIGTDLSKAEGNAAGGTASAQYTDKTITTKYGTATVEETGTGDLALATGKIIYTPTKTDMSGPDAFGYEVHYDTQVPDDVARGYYRSKVTVIPATSIYYEDSFTGTDGIRYETLDEAGNSITSAWNKQVDTLHTDEDGKDSTDAAVHQAEDRPGKYSLSSSDANNVYGFDSAYSSNMTMYSMGSAQKITVVEGQVYGRATFKFSGTGFDVISMTSNKTGTIVVEVKDETGATVRTNLVDTYYGYAYKPHYIEYTYVKLTNGAKSYWKRADLGETLPADKTLTDQTTVDEYQKKTDEQLEGGESYIVTENVWVLAEQNDSYKLYQVPVIKVQGLPYGSYTASINVLYDDFFNHGQDGQDGKDKTDTANSYDFYLDAIRIYNPANVNEQGDYTNTEIKDAYLLDKEGWPIYTELRNLLLSANAFNQDGYETFANGIVYIDGRDGAVSIADYASYGPNNEVYLKKDNSVAFNLDLSGYDKLVYVVDENGQYVKNGEEYILNENPAEGVTRYSQKKESIVADVQIGVKSVSGTVVANIFNVKEFDIQDDNNQVTGKEKRKTNEANREFSTATEMYYSVYNQCTSGLPIGIQNTSADKEAIFSITNIKLTFKENPAGLGTAVFTISAADAAAAAQAMSLAYEESLPKDIYIMGSAVTATEAAMADTAEETEAPAETPAEAPAQTKPAEAAPVQTEAAAAEPVQTEAPQPEAQPAQVQAAEEAPAVEEEAFAPEVKVKTNLSSVKVGSSVRFTVTTSKDVEYVTVDGQTVTDYKTSGEDRIFSSKVRTESVGEKKASVTAYNGSDVASAATQTAIEVTRNYTSLRNVFTDVMDFFAELF